MLISNQGGGKNHRTPSLPALLFGLRLVLWPEHNTYGKTHNGVLILQPGHARLCPCPRGHCPHPHSFSPSNFSSKVITEPGRGPPNSLFAGLNQTDIHLKKRGLPVLRSDYFQGTKCDFFFHKQDLNKSIP